MAPAETRTSQGQTEIARGVAELFAWTSVDATPVASPTVVASRTRILVARSKMNSA